MSSEDQNPRAELPPVRPRLFHAVNALLLASMVIPALLFAGVALYDRSRTIATAERNLLSTLDTLLGHAEKVFEFQALALGVIQERLRGQSNEALLADAASQHAYLLTVRRYAGELLGIVVFGADGRPLVDSNRPVAPRNIDVSDRDYFRWHRDHPGAEPYVAGSIRSRAPAGSQIFFVTMRRSAEDGSFLGVIAAGVQQSTFVDHWDSAAPSVNAMANLTREDGVLLARRPVMQLTEENSQIPPQAPLAQLIRSARERVVVRGVSAFDGVERIIAYRRLERFPVNIAYGMPWNMVLAPWRQRLLIYGGFAIATGLTLFSLALVSKRRTREAHALNMHLEQRVQERTAEIQASETRVRLLAREVDHRAKNALAVVQATLQLTPKTNINAYAEAVQGRVSALSRAQTLLANDQWRGASLPALIRSELEPFVSAASGDVSTRAELDGPSVLLPTSAAQPLAMAMHELATNALKHGALSVPGGKVTLSWWLGDSEDAPGDTLTLRWVETNGPPIAGPPERRGFGFRMLDTITRVQLGGTSSLTWPDTGLICEIKVPLSRLRRQSEGGPLPSAG
jgi:two-component sensor histidine kinase